MSQGKGNNTTLQKPFLKTIVKPHRTKTTNILADISIIKIIPLSYRKVSNITLQNFKNKPRQQALQVALKYYGGTATYRA